MEWLIYCSSSLGGGCRFNVESWDSISRYIALQWYAKVVGLGTLRSSNMAPD